jgi:WD40 repeat protein
LAFAPNGTRLATGDYNGNIYVWDIATGKITATLADPGSGCNGTNNFVPSLAFAPGGTALATGEISGNAYLWDDI